MVIAIHQPEHLPWLGFIDKALKSDALVLLDNVQFRKNYFQNRNKIRTSSGFNWLTVPIKKHPLNTRINEIEIDNSCDWRKKWLKSILQNYSKAPYFNEHAGFFQDICAKKWDRLADLNFKIIKQILGLLNVDNLVLASSLKDVSGNRNDLLLDICLELKADHYLSGISGTDYLDIDKFRQAGVNIKFQQFYHPVYRQCFEPFMPCMSYIDLLFNHGKRFHEILIGRETPRLDYVFE